MQLDPKADCRPWPLAGYAPGNYTCKCIDCEERFSGDKRAIRCLECAAVVANQRLQAVQPVPVLTDEPEFQTAPDNGTVDEVLAYVLDCARRWEPKARIIGNARAGDIVRALTAIASAEPVVTEDAHQFKNFHRLLCERFGYCHDEKDWRRDQVSLIEHIAALTATASAEPVVDEGTYEEGYDEGLRDAQGHAVEVTRAVARWLDNHLGVGNWYDQAEEGFTADDVIQGLFEAVRDPADPLPAQGGKADD